MSDWHQESDGRWFKLDGNGNSRVEIYEAELNDWPPIVELRATIAALLAEPDAYYEAHRNEDDKPWYSHLNAVAARMAAVVEGERNG